MGMVTIPAGTQWETETTMARKIILIGKNEFGFLGDGWYGLERSPEGIWYRAAAPVAEIHLPVQFEKVSISLHVSARPQHTGKPLDVEITAGTGPLFLFCLQSNHWTIRSGLMDLTSNNTLRIHTKNPWSPDLIYHNGDARSLGILLNAIRIESQSRDTDPEPSIWKSLKG